MHRTFLGILTSALVLCAQSTPGFAQQKQLVPIGAGPMVGTFFVTLSGYAKLMKDKLGWNPNVEVTGGPVNNVQLLQAGKIQFGFSTMAPIYEGFHGTGWTKGKKHGNIRTIMATHSSYFHFYTFGDRGIAKITDVKDKRLSAGSTASTPALFSKRVFEILGGPPKAYITGSFADLNNQMRDGLVDVGFMVSGLPHGAVSELSARRPLTIFSFTPAERKKVQAKYPYLKACTIPANTYKGQSADVETVCLWNAIITHKDVPDKLVYDWVKTALANLPTLIQSHNSVKQTKPENVGSLAIPLHKAAAKYYQEMGLAIPNDAKPID